MWLSRYGAMIRIVCFLSSLLALGVPSAFSQYAGALPALRQGSVARTHIGYDLGDLPSATLLRPMHLILSQSLAKKNGLVALSIAQQDIHSEAYHRWISPEQFAENFGASKEEIQDITTWLQSRGMKDIEVSRSHTRIAFTGTVPNVERAFQVKLHRFQVEGEEHYANVTEPRMRTALTGTVSSVEGLNDFDRRPPGNRTVGRAAADAGGEGSAKNLGPGDLAILYDIKPLYAEAAGGGQATIAVIGTAAPSLDDFHAYKKLFGLPANDYRLVSVPGTEVATTAQATVETALDLEIAGGIAPQARLVYVEAYSPFAGAAYVIDNRIADVLSLSYTACETPGPEDFAYESLALQGIVEGITWINASGDSGAAACDEPGAAAGAISGLAVNLPASLPEVTGVGGTRFANLSSTYWSSSPASGGTTALSYVPETAWNGLQENEFLTASGGGSSKDFFKPGYQSSIEDGIAAREVPDLAFDAAEKSPEYVIVTGGRLELVAGTSAATPLFAGITALLNQYLMAHGSLQTPGLGNINPMLYRLAQVAPEAFHDITTGTNRVGCAAGTVDCIDGSLGYNAGAGYDMVTGLGSIDADKLAHAWGTADIGASTILLSAASAASDGTVALKAEVQASENPSPGMVVFSWTNPSYSNVPAEFARVAVDADGIAHASVIGLPNGSNAVTAIFEGTTSLLGSVSTPVVLHVEVTGQPPASVALVDVQVAFPGGINLPLAALVTGQLAAPTGSVDFYLGDALIGSAPVSAGTASTISATLPPVGTNVLTAHYSGDSNYAAEISAPVSITIVGAAPVPSAASPAPDFSITVPAALSISSGESGNFPITIAPSNGFSGAITLTCSGSIDGYGCSVPTTVTPKTSIQVQGTLQSMALGILPIGALLSLGGWVRRKRRWLCGLAAFGLLLQTGCGLTVNRNSAAVYPLTITAVSAGIQHSSVIVVTVQ